VECSTHCNNHVVRWPPLVSDTYCSLGIVSAFAMSNYGSNCVQSSSGSSGSSKYSWLIAVLFCVGGAIVSNFGVNLQKMAHMQKQDGSTPARKYRLLWFFGACSLLSSGTRTLQHPTPLSLPFVWFGDVTNM